MVQRREFVIGLAGSLVRRAAHSAPRRIEVRRLAEKFEEFVRRVRRAGLLFVALVTGLLAVSLVHPIGFLLWFIALPLVGFGAVLSMLWPTRRLLKRTSAAPRLADVTISTLLRLVRLRASIPSTSRTAFNSVVRRLETIETIADASDDGLVIDEAKRLVGQHLPRLVESFLALPAAERTDVRINAFTDGLSAIAEELDDISERLVGARTDRFEVERQFIATRFPRRNGLAGI